MIDLNASYQMSITNPYLPMKKLLLISCIQMMFCFRAVSQETQIAYPLTSVSDSTAYSFHYILPAKTDFQPKLPELAVRYSTLSRSFKINGLHKNLAILIGKTISDNHFIIIDKNANNDLSDDPIAYFSDTLTSPSRGNYRTFKTTLKNTGGKVLSLEFDYSIIKPLPLQIDHGDSLENKIHFMVRPHQYRYTAIKADTATYRAALFSKTSYDFTKKSSFLIIVPDTVAIHSLSSRAKAANKYVEGDIILVGNRKFIFDKVSPLGDTLFMTPILSKSEAYGNKVGFLAPDFSGKDILSQDPILARNLKGKYILLDFWGTWCGPCLKLLPDLKKLHSILDSQKIAMIGVCYDKNIGIASEFLKKQAISWPQLFDPQANSTFGKSFAISAYPSFVLIDSTGKIVFKDEGLNGFQRLSEHLSQLGFQKIK